MIITRGCFDTCVRDKSIATFFYHICDHNLSHNPNRLPYSNLYQCLMPPLYLFLEFEILAYCHAVLVLCAFPTVSLLAL